MKNPSWYFPIESGKYEVKPGLSFLDLNKEPGFEFDKNYYDFRENILLKQQYPATKENYFQKHNFTVEPEICEWLSKHLSYYYPEYFEYRKFSVGKRILDCFLTNERLIFNSAMELIDVLYLKEKNDLSQCKNYYSGSFDAITSQLQEDVCVLQKDKEKHWISAISLFCPNGWTAKQKIGGTFNSIHQPVAMFEKIASNQDKIVNRMISTSKPYVRFAWGLHNNFLLDRRLDDNWWGVGADLNLRVERQLIFGLKDINASIFTIRTYKKLISDLLRFNPEQFNKLRNAIETMPEEAQKYKGIYGHVNEILENFHYIQCPENVHFI